MFLQIHINIESNEYRPLEDNAALKQSLYDRLLWRGVKVPSFPDDEKLG